MPTSKGERILQLIDIYADGIKGRFAKMFDVTPQNISNWIKRDFIPYEEIYNRCKGVNLNWLFSGEGSPISQPDQAPSPLSGSDLSVLIDRIESQAKQIARLEYQLEQEIEQHKETKAQLEEVQHISREEVLLKTAGGVEESVALVG